MATSSFRDLEQAFLACTAKIVLCTVTTVGPTGQPRSRMLHPVFEVLDGLPVGWVCTGRTPVEVAHLAHEPRVAVCYWSPDNDTVVMECRASWVDDPADKQHVWDLFMRTPPPLGYDLTSYGAPDAPAFTPLRLDPTRVQVMAGSEYRFGDLRGRVWRRPPP